MLIWYICNWFIILRLYLRLKERNYRPKYPIHIQFTMLRLKELPIFKRI